MSYEKGRGEKDSLLEHDTGMPKSYPHRGLGRSSQTEENQLSVQVEKDENPSGEVRESKYLTFFLAILKFCAVKLGDPPWIWLKYWKYLQIPFRIAVFAYLLFFAYVIIHLGTVSGKQEVWFLGTGWYQGWQIIHLIGVLLSFVGLFRFKDDLDWKKLEQLKLAETKNPLKNCCLSSCCDCCTECCVNCSKCCTAIGDHEMWSWMGLAVIHSSLRMLAWYSILVYTMWKTTLLNGSNTGWAFLGLEIVFFPLPLLRFLSTDVIYVTFIYVTRMYAKEVDDFKSLVRQEIAMNRPHAEETVWTKYKELVKSVKSFSSLQTAKYTVVLMHGNASC